MTVKGLHTNAKNKPSVFTLDNNSFKNNEPNSGGSPGHDVNLNHLNIVNPSHSQSHSFSPTREVPDQTTQISKKSILHLKEKRDERLMIDSNVEMIKNDEFVLKTPEKDLEHTLKDVSLLART
jgi:hypothetical protein